MRQFVLFSRFCLIATVAAVAFSSGLYAQNAPADQAPLPMSHLHWPFPPPDQPFSSNKVVDTVHTSRGDLRIRPLFHGSIFFEFNGKAIYVDPWGWTDYTGLPPADLIVITHTHPDHLDHAMVDKLHKPETLLVGPDAVIDDLNCTPMCGTATTVNNGEKKEVDGIGFAGIAMYNITKVAVPGVPSHHKGVGSGYVMSFGDTRVFISGDTECVPEIKALHDISIAFIAMSAGRTMSPLEAADCVKAFKPRIVYPYHYRGSNPQEFIDAIKGTSGVEVRLRKLEGEK